MIRSRRRRTSFWWPWWPWPRRRTHTAIHARPAGTSGSGSPRWATDPTVHLPTVRYAPLMTRAEAYRGNGGRWTR
jgi:hypothetical protein